MAEASNNVAECLMIIASSAACAGERDLVREVLRNIGIGFTCVEWLSGDDFKQQISGKKYNFIYLGAHADSHGFGEDSRTARHPWESLALAICETDCIQPGGTLFMGCCRGGMKTVAIKIMRQCERIDQICGPFWTLKDNDIMKAFHIFVETLVRGKKDPVMAADRASQASNCKFRIYERMDIEADLELLSRVEAMEKTFVPICLDAVAALKKEIQQLRSGEQSHAAAPPATSCSERKAAKFGESHYS